jgi:TatD DNase family protein
MFIDTHCHLYLPEFKNDIHSVIERAEKEGISRFYLPSIDSSTTSDLIALEQEFPQKCFAMMGLHPCSVKENYVEELRLVEEWLTKRHFVAIGEIGLDYYWDRSFEMQQALAFHQQIEWALQYDRPIVIHSRNAIKECINIVKEHQTGNLRGIFHCFSGSYEQASSIIDIGLYLGIGGVITYKNSGLAEVVSRIPLGTMVLETDAPYLSPVPFRGKRNESAYLRHVIEKIALCRNVSPAEVGAITTENSLKIFNQ